MTALWSARSLSIYLALALLDVIVYAPVWHHPFVNFDDDAYVTHNPVVARGLTWPGVQWAFTTGYFQTWSPLTWLSHMVDVEMYGIHAGGHHLTSLLLHILNTLLLFGILQGMTGAVGRSAFVAALFAVHPLHVESVAWIAERKDVLSTLFAMLTLWAYVAYVRKPGRSRYALALLFLALGLMSKPMLVTFPFVLLLLDVWPLRRVKLGEPGQQTALWQVLWEKVPMIVLVIASSVVTFFVQEPARSAHPLHARIANALVSYVAYMYKAVWPAGLAVFYPFRVALPGWEVWGSAVFLVTLSVLLLGAARKRPYLAVGWLWYLGTLIPVIGLVQVGEQAMADRYTYIPLIGLFIIASWGMADLSDRRPQQAWAFPAAAVLIVLSLTVAARRQVDNWRDSLTLWTHTLQVTTDNETGQTNLGNALLDQGRPDEAMVHYREALRIRPEAENAHYGLGIALFLQGKVDEAVAEFREALRIKPGLAVAHNGLGMALFHQGKVDEAIAEFREALRIEPDPDAYYNLGAIAEGRNETDEAVREYQQALRLNPNYTKAWQALGRLNGYGQLGAGAQPGPVPSP